MSLSTPRVAHSARVFPARATRGPNALATCGPGTPAHATRCPGVHARSTRGLDAHARATCGLGTPARATHDTGVALRIFVCATHTSNFAQPHLVYR
jgi:hypothetical protein